MANYTWATPLEVFNTHPELDFIKVSNFGKVYSTRASKLLKQSKMKNGYLRLVIRINGVSTTKLAHRLVAETFIPNPLDHKTVNHRDGNKENNTLINLEWCSYAENNAHAHALGLNYISKLNRSRASNRASEVWKFFRGRKARGENPDRRLAFRDYKAFVTRYTAKGDAA